VLQTLKAKSSVACYKDLPSCIVAKVEMPLTATFVGEHSCYYCTWVFLRYCHWEMQEDSSTLKNALFGYCMLWVQSIVGTLNCSNRWTQQLDGLYAL
jgi:hypothetical protein